MYSISQICSYIWDGISFPYILRLTVFFLNCAAALVFAGVIVGIILLVLSLICSIGSSKD